MLRKKFQKIGLTAVAITSALAVSSVSHAALSEYGDDFQGYGAAAFFTPWNGFSDNGGFPGGYGFAPSTSGPQITALANDGAGNDYLNMYANYDNAPVHTGGAPRPQEAISVFIQQSFDGAEAAAGATWTFDFDFREADSPFGPAGDTQVGAFIRVFDAAFNLLADDTLNTAGSTTWQNGQLSMTLNSIWANGGIIQFGFNNLVGNYEASGMYYDNACWSTDGGCVDAPVVPVPAAVWLFGSGLLGLIGVARRRKS
ncbi:MAG: hypothetical protein WBN96_04165 [Gammaproteobacteria bacterium]